MVANAQVKFASLGFRLFRNMYLAGTCHFIAPQLLILTLIKGTIIFGGGPVSFIYSFISDSYQQFHLILSILFWIAIYVASFPQVVIPLLREYVVQPGFVSPRDFLIGLAIIQAFPGPNFNCE